MLLLCFIVQLLILSERNSILDVLLYICDRHSFLLHRVTFTDCYATVLNAVEVVCDAEGSTDLVLSSVSLTDSASVIEFTVVLLGKLRKNLFSALVHLLGKRQ